VAELSERYASALFEVAREDGTLDECQGQAQICLLMLQTEECRALVSHPHIPNAQKRTFFNKSAGSLNERLEATLHLMIAKKREMYMASAMRSFIKMVDAENGRTEAFVISASALDARQIEKIGETLSKKLCKNVRVTHRVDPALLGGMQIQVDGYLIDYTVRKRLGEMTKEILHSG